MKELTAAEAREALHYEPETGVLTWKVRAAKRVRVGDVAGFSRNGYRYIRINGVDYRAHRVAWLLTNGEWPCGVIDHINGDPTDNRWSNLRCVDRRVNMENQRRARSDNETGVLGVAQAISGRFLARIGVGGKQIHLGTFPTVEMAHSAYLKAKRHFHEGCTI